MTNQESANPSWDDDYKRLWMRLQSTQERLTRYRVKNTKLAEALRHLLHKHDVASSLTATEYQHFDDMIRRLGQ